MQPTVVTVSQDWRVCLLVCFCAVVSVLVSVVSSFVLRYLVIATIRNTKNNQIDRTLKSLE